MTDPDFPETSEPQVPEPEAPSKSQLKREMLALQALGEKLLKLSPAQRQRFALPEKLEAALEEHKRIPKHEAKRRQMQYIGKLMREADHEGIREEFEKIEQEQIRGTLVQQRAIQWGEKLLEGGNPALTEFIDRYPDTDIQHLRQLLQKAGREKQQNTGGKPAPDTHRKKLFKLIQAILVANT